MRQKVLVDTSYWIALLQPNKEPIRNKAAEEISDILRDNFIVIPFPTLYEFVNTKLSRKDHRQKFSEILDQSNVIKISDDKYKEAALQRCFIQKHYFEDVSLVDEIIKLMLQDDENNINYIVTFDTGLKNAALSLGKTAL